MKKRKECLLIIIKDFLLASVSSHNDPNGVYRCVVEKLETQYETVNKKYILTSVKDQVVDEQTFLKTQTCTPSKCFGYTKVADIIDSYDYVTKDVYVVNVTDGLSIWGKCQQAEKLLTRFLDKVKLFMYIECTTDYTQTPLKVKLKETITSNVVVLNTCSRSPIYRKIKELNLQNFPSFLTGVEHLDCVRIHNYSDVTWIIRNGRTTTIKTVDGRYYSYKCPQEVPYDESKCFIEAYKLFLQSKLNSMMARLSSIT